MPKRMTASEILSRRFAAQMDEIFLRSLFETRTGTLTARGTTPIPGSPRWRLENDPQLAPDPQSMEWRIATTVGTGTTPAEVPPKPVEPDEAYLAKAVAARRARHPGTIELDPEPLEPTT